MDWGNDDCLRLIDVYEEHPVLWNHRHDFYYNKNKKQKAWSDIAQEFGSSASEVKRKMESLLSSFRREKAKGKKTIGTGEDTREVYVSKWFAFKRLAFLLDKDEPRKTSNSPDNSDDLSIYDASEKTIGEGVQETDDSALFAVEAVYQVDTATNSDAEETADMLQPGDNVPKNALCPTSMFPKVSKPCVQSPVRKSLKRPVSDSEEDPKISEALDILETAMINKVRVAKADDCSIYGQHVANKLREYNKRTKAIVQHHINNILFQADMGQYDGNSNIPPMNLLSCPTSTTSCQTSTSISNIPSNCPCTLTCLPPASLSANVT